MPISCAIPIAPISDEDFKIIDKVVMNCAYAAQNRLGRLCDERVYENDVAARLRAEGLTDVHTQVRVTVSHRGFQKTYRLDLVVNGMIYELKVVDALGPTHDAQVFHYAALLDIGLIKLINFGGISVKGMLHACPFPSTDRRLVTVNRQRWKPLSPRCETLAADAEACFRDWGGFLDCRLTEEALSWINGGDLGCEQRLLVIRDGIELGSHAVYSHAEDCAFIVTSMFKDTAAHENQLRRLLDVLPIRGWQWINIQHRQMKFITVLK
jgi:GxxExxY protein